MTISHRFPQIHVRETAERENPKKKRTGRGYDHERKTRQATLLTDAQVIEARGLREFLGHRVDLLAKRFGVSITYMRTLLDYQTRSKLCPRAEDFPLPPPGTPKP